MTTTMSNPFGLVFALVLVCALALLAGAGIQAVIPQIQQASASSAVVVAAAKEVEVEADLTFPGVRVSNPADVQAALQCLDKNGAFRASKSRLDLIRLLCEDSDDAHTVYDVTVREAEKGKFTLRGAEKSGDGTIKAGMNLLTRDGWQIIDVPAQIFNVIIKVVQ